MMFPLLFGGRKGGQTSQLHLSLINLSDGVEKCSFDKQEARRLRISTQGCQVAPGRGDAGGGGLWPGWRTCCGAGRQVVHSVKSSVVSGLRRTEFTGIMQSIYL